MTTRALEIKMEKAGIHKRRPQCPDCKKKATKIWISHKEQWMPCGILCKHCGFVQIWGVPDQGQDCAREG